MINRQIKMLALALVIVFAAVLPAAAQTDGPPYRLFLPVVQKSKEVLTLSASADAYVFEAGPNVNTGNEELLYVGNDQDPESRLGVLRSFVRFDLPPVAGPRIERATLRLFYGGYADFPNTSRMLSIKTVNDPWDERTITWANQPATGYDVGGDYIISGSHWGYREFDVTNHVQNLVNQAMPNNGFALRWPENGDDDWSIRVFGARESPIPPYLVITLAY